MTWPSLWLTCWTSIFSSRWSTRTIYTIHQQWSGSTLHCSKWALCAFTEAGLLRFLTHPKARNLPMDEAVAILSSLKREPGYHYLPVVADWHQTTAPFAARLHGHNQV